MIDFKEMFKYETVSSALSSGRDGLEKQWEKNPTAVGVGAVALGVLGVIGVARQINCPKVIPSHICNDAGFPEGTRGVYTEAADGTTSSYTATAFRFSYLTLRWTEANRTMSWQAEERKT